MSAFKTPAHRPRLDPTAARVVKPLRVHPVTALGIDRAAKTCDISAGRVVDWLALLAPTVAEESKKTGEDPMEIITRLIKAI